MGVIPSRLGKFDIEIAIETIYDNLPKPVSETKVIVIGLDSENTGIGNSRRLDGAYKARQYETRITSTIDQTKGLIKSLQQCVDEIEKSESNTKLTFA